MALPKMFFFGTFLSSWTPINSNHHQTCTDVEHYVTCMNVTTNVRNDFYQSIQGVRYVGNQLQNPFLRGPVLAPSQITIRTSSSLKSKGKMRLTRKRLFSMNNLIFKGYIGSFISIKSSFWPMLSDFPSIFFSQG